MNLFTTIEQMLDRGEEPDRHAEQLWQQFGRTYAVLIMDSSGFTRITKEYGILPFLSRLVQMRRLAIPVLEQCRAVAYKFAADNVYGYFESPTDALEAAFGIRDALATAGVTLPDGTPFTICSGIGYGKVLYSETLEGCFGDEMNLASKLGEDIAEADEILLTQACYDALPETQQQQFFPITTEVSRTDITYYTSAADLG